MQSIKAIGIGILVLALPVLALPASAQTIDTSTAQGAMINYVNRTVERFANQIGVDDGLIDFCRLEMHLHTRHEENGLIPFGINYNKIKSREVLDLVIQSRANYEVNFLKLCLARAKKDLNAALKD